jgi:ribosomal protein S18 acetylase RimI-like enzyme
MIEARVEPLEERHLEDLRRFLDGLPERDLTFIKEDVRDHAVVEGWVRRGEPDRRARHFVAVDGAGVLALLSVVPQHGWSSHVGDLRLVVDPAARHQGLGATLARRALREALDMGLEKVVVEVVAEQTGAVQMFSDLGFRGEALLTCHIRDRGGELRDLLVLAHDVGEEWSAMASLGVEGDVGPN